MEKILFVNACIRPGSRTLTLARRVLERLGGEAEEVDLARRPAQPLTAGALAERDALIGAGDFTHPMFQPARQYAAADVIVVAAPCWDMSFPAVLKAYLESVMVLGVTFSYSPEGMPMGLCRARELIYITTAGGPLAAGDLGYQYVKALARTYHGIPRTLCFGAENLDVQGADVEAILDGALAEIDGADL